MFLQLLFNNVLAYLVAFAVILFGLVFHNIVQALIAGQQGDQTPRLRGFTKTDPQIHITGISLIFLAAFGFAVPNPIPLNSRAVRGRGGPEAWVWMSGVLGLIVWAFILAIAYGLTQMYLPGELRTISTGLLIGMLRVLDIAVMNVFPIPPLDGARALVAVGNIEARRFVGQLEQFINSVPLVGFMLIFIILDQLGFLKTVSRPIVMLMNYALSLLGLPPVPTFS